MIEGASEFFVAAAGAAAALAGLIIVALSVSVDAIIRMPGMTSRAATAIALLVATTVTSLAGLIPGQPAWAFGVEALIAGLAAVGFALVSTVKVVRGHGQFSVGSALLRSGISLVPALLLVVGALLAFATSDATMPVLGIGMLLSIAISVTTAWVVLVEIRR